MRWGDRWLSKMVSTSINNSPSSSTLHNATSLAFSELVDDKPQKKQRQRAKKKKPVKKTIQDFSKESLNDFKPPEVKAYAE